MGNVSGLCRCNDTADRGGDPNGKSQLPDEEGAAEKFVKNSKASKTISAEGKSEYIAITFHDTNGFKMIPANSDPDVLWKGLTGEKNSAVMFETLDGRETWSIYKEMGEDISRIKKIKAQYLPAPESPIPNIQGSWYVEGKEEKESFQYKMHILQLATEITGSCTNGRKVFGRILSNGDFSFRFKDQEEEFKCTVSSDGQSVSNGTYNAESFTMNRIPQQMEVNNPQSDKPWSYSGKNSAPHWSTLCDAFKVAKNGIEQSPIDIITDSTIKKSDSPSLNLHYSSTEATMVNNGHSVQVNLDGGHLVIDEKKYDLKQYHFHAPSEHTINGEQFALELHLVHQCEKDKSLAVVGILYREGEEDTFLKQFWDDMPQDANKEFKLDAIDCSDLNLTQGSYFRYKGSLTTPPCSEGVTWTVMKQIKTASVLQMVQFRNAMPFDNFRPVQPHHARKVEEHLVEGDSKDDIKDDPQSNDEHWCHSGEKGPHKWSKLDQNYIIAETGLKQSPINIELHLKQDSKESSLDVHYSTNEATIINNGHTVQVDWKSTSTKDFITNEKKFQLVQFHFHGPSEHTIDGKRFPLEMHLVHAAEDGSLAVVGILFQEGGENEFLKQFWDQLPHQKSEKGKKLTKPIHMDDLALNSDAYYRYDGSLTTPPCSEGVIWSVMTKIQTISKNQLHEFHKCIPFSNYRPIQALNERPLFCCNHLSDVTL